ncbi:glycosyltransferase [Phocaeicola coprophilus]|uniref:glycosyltransferase n=1 Tax=Phocaeicola coprophilus TaxID=387090 RepID=UPI0039F61376
MKILFVYRNPAMGYSIGKVFYPIEREMKNNCQVDSIKLPCSNYSITSLWKNVRSLIHKLKDEKYDIVHITGTEHYLLPFLTSYNTIITVHDLGFYTEQKKSLKLLGKYLLWIKSLSYAKYVTFISDFSQQEALKLVHLSRHSVVYNPISSEFQPSLKEFNEKCPRILHIGTKPNKNLFNTIEALKDLSCRLRIIGKLSEAEKEHLQKNHIDYSNAYNLSDQEIIQEYQQCDIVNFPSLYEGFGMPILEGQSIGRVVITSNISPMKDIAKDTAILVNPTDVNSIRNGYKRAIELHDLYVERGYKNIKRFSVETITNEYKKIYELIR